MSPRCAHSANAFGARQFVGGAIFIASWNAVPERSKPLILAPDWGCSIFCARRRWDREKRTELTSGIAAAAGARDLRHLPAEHKSGRHGNAIVAITASTDGPVATCSSRRA